MAWTSVDFILNQRMNPYHQWREEIYTATKQASGMSPNSVGLKDKYVFVKSTVLIKNPPFYNGDIVEKRDHHHDFRIAIWPPYRLLSGAGMHAFGWEYHNWFEILCLNVDYERGCSFLLDKCVILVEHISTVILDTKTCITVRKLINAPSPCEVIIGGHNKTLIIDSLSAEKI